MNEVCPVCLDTLPVDVSTTTRMLCCGKAMHTSCYEDIHKSTMNHKQKNACPLCRTRYPSTDKEKLKQLRKWVEKGAAWAQTNLASQYQFGELGLTQSYDNANPLLKMAIAQGDPHAMFQLGTMYYDGRGVDQSYERAIELYTMAANLGHAGVHYNLGILYRNGQGVEQSFERAIELFEMAAANEDADAQSNLGSMYYSGQGVEQSFEFAREWWTKAAEQGHEDAIENLKILDEMEGKTTTPTTRQCSTCGAPETTDHKLRSCKKCHVTQYCNRKCQLKHWNEGGHKRECKKLRQPQQTTKSTSK